MQIAIPVLFLAVSARADVFGTWTMDSSRSTLVRDPQPKSLTIRIERHTMGEVFTLDRVEADGRATTYSSLLYLDGKPNDFQDDGCSGIPSSRRMDGQVMEIIRTCTTGGWIRLLRRFSGLPNELVLDITERDADGRRTERHLVLEKSR
jgi:hypothetical protein